jgi:hypothetical protein
MIKKTKNCDRHWARNSSLSLLCGCLGAGANYKHKFMSGKFQLFQDSTSRSRGSEMSRSPKLSILSSAGELVSESSSE